jgi:hypothetical protein
VRGMKRKKGGRKTTTTLTSAPSPDVDVSHRASSRRACVSPQRWLQAYGLLLHLSRNLFSTPRLAEGAGPRLRSWWERRKVGWAISSEPLPKAPPDDFDAVWAVMRRRPGAGRGEADEKIVNWRNEGEIEETLGEGAGVQLSDREGVVEVVWAVILRRAKRVAGGVPTMTFFLLVDGDIGWSGGEVWRWGFVYHSMRVAEKWEEGQREEIATTKGKGRLGKKSVVVVLSPVGGGSRISTVRSERRRKPRFKRWAL